MHKAYMHDESKSSDASHCAERQSTASAAERRRVKAGAVRSLGSRILALGLASTLAGCGTVAQAVFGWDKIETRSKNENKTIAVTSAPPGVHVVRRASDGSEVQ